MSIYMALFVRHSPFRPLGTRLLTTFGRAWPAVNLGPKGTSRLRLAA